MSIDNINAADQSIIIRPPLDSKGLQVKEIRFELDGVDPEVLRQAATAKGLNVEQYLKSIAEQIATHPNMAKVLRIAKSASAKK